MERCLFIKKRFKILNTSGHLIRNGRFNEKDNEVYLLWSKMAASFCSARDMSYGFVSRKCYASYGRTAHTTFKEIRKKKMPQISNKIRTTNNKCIYRDYLFCYDLRHDKWTFLEGVKTSGALPQEGFTYQEGSNAKAPNKLLYCCCIEVLVSLPVIDADVVKRILPYVVSRL
ncbi:hypothetical protein L1987_46583 [Smallanthus sonchifolius]|uniref:Uncharacterized protein n=1 Tax=Smallanthus sonchifolius TaxID=185202 RepID=A0ACB9G161_9ASTR|nr:hypothetical protein L1987_46583 [Smallanthus sonchifolius]